MIFVYSKSQDKTPPDWTGRKLAFRRYERTWRADIQITQKKTSTPFLRLQRASNMDMCAGLVSLIYFCNSDSLAITYRRAWPNHRPCSHVCWTVSCRISTFPEEKQELLERESNCCNKCQSREGHRGIIIIIYKTKSKGCCCNIVPEGLQNAGICFQDAISINF